MIIVVMGVAGSGKSVVGAALAERLGARFIEGDAHHPEANVARMRAGIPLRDADRWPWLDRLADELATLSRGEGDGVLACSALKRSYRDRLAAPGVVFVHLTAPRETLEARVAARPAHFMPASLVASQLDALEPLAGEEQGLTVSSEEPLSDLVSRILAWLDSLG